MKKKKNIFSPLRAGCLSTRGVGILDGPERLRSSKNLKIIISFEFMIRKHAKAEFSTVNPVLLIELSVKKPRLEGSRILRGRTARRCTYLLLSPSLLLETSSKCCLFPADKTAPIMPHSQAPSVGRILLAATHGA